MQNENETRCNFCNLSFRSIQQRNKHFTSYSHQVATAEDMVAKNPTIALGTPLTSTAAGKRSCQLCNLQFLTKPIRDLHVRTSQRHKELFGCGTCNQGFQDQGDLSKHMRTVSHKASGLAAQKLNLSAPPILQHAPQEASNTTFLPVQVSLEREKGRRTSGNHYSSPITNPIGSFPLGLGPSERNCRLCDVSVKRGEVNVHRLGWLHVDRSRTKGFYCEVCKKAFLGPFGIQMHNERIHAPPVMRNVSVNVRFTTASTRKERKQTKALAVTGNLLQEALSPYNLHWRSIFCDICSTDRTPGENIRSHKRSQQHIDACKAQNLYCGDCDIIFDIRFEQCIHADTHQKLPPKRCDICDEEILESETTDGQLQFHLDTFTRSNLCCSECNMHFGTDRVNFLAHTLKSHVPPRPVRFNCRHCNQHFPFEEYIRHNCLNPIAEEIPSATSYSAASYSTQDNKLIDCLGSSKCPRRFKNLSAMIQHLESGTCLQDLDGTGINVLVGRNSAKMEKPHPEVDEEVGRSSSDEQAGETSNGVRVFSLVEQN